MNVLDVKENGDGSCTLDVEFEEQEVESLLSYAVSSILEKQLDKMTKSSMANDN